MSNTVPQESIVNFPSADVGKQTGICLEVCCQIILPSYVCVCWCPPDQLCKSHAFGKMKSMMSSEFCLLDWEAENEHTQLNIMLFFNKRKNWMAQSQAFYGTCRELMGQDTNLFLQRYINQPLPISSGKPGRPPLSYLLFLPVPLFPFSFTFFLYPLPSSFPLLVVPIVPFWAFISSHFHILSLTHLTLVSYVITRSLVHGH